MSDCIDRALAMSGLQANRQRMTLAYEAHGTGYVKFSDEVVRISDAMNMLRDLPSAQSEIIYCGDCRYKDDGIDEDGIPFLKCLHGRSYGGTRINDFCSWAERRSDE